ncbi:hypothetical protein CAEBREN_30473 [Caenorhabditis brenneri]|uniref:C2H2-type domain-containing protein n=1 Tax=Caenorhabditis brenneri TaxID=135651 RepID=G0P0T1_CAEBE|nr:hypothetical protein CAEBREN_30473 [Caenorhabditis brenneri]
MDYDPTTQQYRERNNASWDRIRHENASSVRSEPADPSYLFNSFDYNFDPFPELLPPQEDNNYVPQDLLNLDYAPIIDNNQLDHSLQTLQPVNLEPLPYHPLDSAPLEIDPLEITEDLEPEENGYEEEDDDEDVEESSSSDENDEVDRPDVYCMDCCSKIDDVDAHDLVTCSKAKAQKYECGQCPKKFNFEKNMKVHRILEHLKPIDFVVGTACQFCPKEPKKSEHGRPTFSRFTAYLGHVKIHLKPDFLKCEQCGVEFPSEKELDRHVRRDHSDEAYELSFCPKCKKIITLEDSAAHCLLHLVEKRTEKKQPEKKKEPPKPTLLAKLQPPKRPPPKTAAHKRKRPCREKKFQCTECPKAFVRPSELARHSMIHLRKKFQAPKPYDAPPIVLPKWTCLMCDKEYCHKSGLMEHKKNVHGNAKQFVCQLCGAKFTKKSNQARHMKRIHPVDQDSKEKSQYQCADCPTVLSTMGALTRHKREYHLKAPHMKVTKVIPVYERHLCTICKREFRDAKMLDKHRRLHLRSEGRWRDVQGGGERKCDFCDKSFVLRASLIWHVQKHYEEQQQEEEAQQEEPYCSLCDLNFYSQLEFRQHQDEQHSVVCGSCHQKFSSHQVYKDHICSKRLVSRSGLLPNNRVIICRQCRPPQRLTTARQIKEHRARHLPRKTHLCWTCHKSFRTAQLLSLHAEVHDRQPVQCAHCPQVFHSRVALKQHTRISHGGDTNYQCVVHVDRTMAMSAQSFAEYGLAADHNDEQAHRAHSVTECMDTEEEIIPQEQMEQDLIRYQPMNQISIQQQIARSIAAEAPIRCEVCHHLYENIERLCDHWQGSDTDADHSFQIVTCPICETRIRSAAEAANHVRNAHLFARPKIFDFMKPSVVPEMMPLVEPTDDSRALVPAASSVMIQQSIPVNKGHQCLQCDKVFTRKNDMQRHMKIHTGEKNHVCPECNRGFRVKSTLKAHMQTHSDNPPEYQCTVCEKSLYEKKALVVHMRIHTGEQPHKCRFCDLHFR